MSNFKRKVSIALVAIFTTFAMLGSVPFMANAATKKVVKKPVKKVVVSSRTVLVTAQKAVSAAESAVKIASTSASRLKAANVAYSSANVAIAKVSRKYYSRDIAALAKRMATVKSRIAAATRALAASTALTTAYNAVDKAEALTDTDTYDLVGNDKDLTNAQDAMTTAIEKTVAVKSINLPAYKGLMARIDAANKVITDAMSQRDDIQAAKDAAAAEKAAVDSATKAVAAYEAAPLATDADATAAVTLQSAAKDAVAKLTADDAQPLSDRIAKVDAALKALNDQLAAAKQPAKVLSVAATADGTLTVTMDKAPLTTPVAADFSVNQVVNGTAAAATISTVAVNGSVVTLTVPAVAATNADQNVIYNVSYQLAAAVTADAVTVAKLADVAIDSASALDKVQIKVVFNQLVDKTSAETVTNYSLNGVALDATATAALGADGKSVILTAAPALGGFATTTLSADKGYIVSVTGVKSLDTLRTASAINSAAFTLPADTTGPSLVSAIATVGTANNVYTVTATFNEPVQGVGTYTINGKVASPTLNTVASNTVTLTTTDPIVAGTAYSLVVMNEKDAANNVLAVNPTTTSVAVTVNTAAPTVSVSTSGDKTIVLKFSNTMDPTTMNTTNIKLLDGNLATSTVGYSVTQGDDATIWNINLLSNVVFNSNNQLPLTVVVTNAVKDSLGNVANTSQNLVTVTKNSLVPAITSIQYVKPGDTYDGTARTNGALVLTFNEDLASAPSIVGGTDVTVISDQGALENAKLGTSVGTFKTDTTNTVIYPLTAAFTGTAAETLRFNAGVFTDTSIAANKNAAQVLTVDLVNTVKDSVSSVADSSAPVVTVNNVTGNTISLTMTDNVGLDPASVLNVGNYRMNGGLLPDGSYVVIGGTLTNANVTIYLPAGSIPATAVYTINAVGIKDAAGNIASSAVGTTTIQDNKKPTMTGLTLNADGTMTIAFDEAVTGAIAADFTITKATVAGATASTLVAGTDYTVAPGTAGDTGKVVVTFNSALAAGNVITVTTAANPVVNDGSANANTAVAGTTLSVSK